MTTYSYAQLQGLWANAGGKNPAVAAAVAEAESSGNSDATSANPDGGTNVGLWQLDTPGGKGAGYSVAQLKDPATNAKVAVAGSSGGTDWSAWETYVTGAYRQFLNGSTTPDTNVPGASTAASTAGTGASSIATFNSANCLVGIPDVNPVPSWVPVLGTSTGFCLLSKSEARGMLGAALMVMGGGVAALGLIILAAGAFSATGAGHRAGGALEAAGAGLAVVPGAEGAGLALAATGAAARRAGTAPRQSIERRRAAREARRAAPQPEETAA